MLGPSQRFFSFPGDEFNESTASVQNDSYYFRFGWGCKQLPPSFYLHIKSSRWCNTIFTAYKIRYCAMEHANRQITQLKYWNQILRFFFISLLFGISKKKCTLHRRHHYAIYWLSRNGDLLLSVECVLKRNIEHHPALFNVCGGRCKKRQLVLSL